MIITAPNRFAAAVHDRMPVLPRQDQFDAWSQRVNSSRASNDDPTLIGAIALAA
jgi:putative SOS response-associated peptidase YedK